MALPIKIAVGMVSIYGSGSAQGIFNVNNNLDIQFGLVNGTNAQYSSVSIGQSVMYDKNDALTVFYIDTPYYIVPEDKIISIEDTLTPP